MQLKTDPEVAQPVGEYNYRHYRTKHLLWPLYWTAQSKGIRAGDQAPDFELPATDGQPKRLSDFRGKPVVLRFGSPT
jgi:hypothetical protein